MVRKKDGNDMPGKPQKPEPEAPALTASQRSLLQHSRKKTKVRIDGEDRMLSLQELLNHKRYQMALNGSSHHATGVARDIAAAEQLEQAELKQRADFGRWWKRRQQKQFDALKAAGESTDSVLPHPDDIETSFDQGYRVTGPLDEEELKQMRSFASMRDAALIQMALEDRLGPEAGDRPGLRNARGASAGALVEFYNSILPRRFQLSRNEILMRTMRFDAKSKRELLKLSHQAWRTAGRHLPRGFRFPTADRFLPLLARMHAFTRDEMRRCDNGFPSSLEEIAGELQEMLGLLKTPSETNFV